MKKRLELLRQFVHETLINFPERSMFLKMYAIGRYLLGHSSLVLY